ncbi:MAG: phosphatase PAP2 family protein [Candidatus Aenigmarchaeota archaeon]|nr:phosphatase PAP2 family protein [Candidatus Aenigmarchaeota archaeon]
MEFPVLYFDREISRIFSKFNKKDLRLMSKLSNYFLMLASLSVLLYFILKGEFFLLLVSIPYLYAIWFLFVFVQNNITRKRPYVFYNKDFGSRTPSNHSFPSTHTILSIFYVIVSLVLVKEKALMYLFIILSSIVPILRITSLQHWLSDVLSGIVFSIVVYLVWYRLLTMFLHFPI